MLGEVTDLDDIAAIGTGDDSRAFSVKVISQADRIILIAVVAHSVILLLVFGFHDPDFPLIRTHVACEPVMGFLRPIIRP